MRLRRTRRAVGTACALAALTAVGMTAGAATAAADTGTAAADTGTAQRARAPRTVIPLPKVTVTRMCGTQNDIVTLDPAWLAAWGDKVEIFPDSLTFQGGDDGDLAKPAGQIREEFRSRYRWAGTRGAAWNTWLLYPGTVRPIVDENVPCPVAVAAPRLTQTAVCGPRNDRVKFADEASAGHWRIASRTWSGNTLTLTLRVKRGFIGPDGATTIEQEFIDSGACPRA